MVAEIALHLDELIQETEYTNYIF